MSFEVVHTLIVGGGQAGLAMSGHLSNRGVAHLVVERSRIVERWRSERWDSLVANGPAWHDRFPTMEFADIDPDSFATKDRIVEYFEAYARQIEAPIRCGVEVRSVETKTGGSAFRVETSEGVIEATNVVAATGPFQRPLIPAVVPDGTGVMQLHSSGYRNPGQLPDGAVLVVGAGSSGAQIADELLRAERRGRSLGRPARSAAHQVSREGLLLVAWDSGHVGRQDQRTGYGACHHRGQRRPWRPDRGFPALCRAGMTLLGRAGPFEDGVMHIAPDLERNIAGGDATYLFMLDAADAYVTENNLDFPEEPNARVIPALPACVADPVLELNLAESGITSIVWATGFAIDFSWLKADTFDASGRPLHDKGVSKVPGLYFLGLPWLSRRASPFIWGVWHDAEYLASHIAARSAS